MKREIAGCLRDGFPRWTSPVRIRSAAPKTDTASKTRRRAIRHYALIRWQECAAVLEHGFERQLTSTVQVCSEPDSVPALREIQFDSQRIPMH